ncbi:MAG: hypothetical protein ACE14M_01345 [Terriglobales bacterium]
MATETSAARLVRARVACRWPDTPVRVLVLSVLFTAAAACEVYQLKALLDRDIWWHLRTGLWILQNHTVPRHRLFSQHADLPWVNSNWAFDLLAGAAYKLLGVRVIPGLLMGLRVALAGVTFLLARSRGNFWSAVLLSAIAQYAIADLPPSAGAVSVLFFGMELMLLIRSRSTGKVRPLLWLPLLFLLWANLHTQFMNGLVLLALFLLDEAVRAIRARYRFELQQRPALPLSKIAAVASLSLLATLATPYSFRILLNAFDANYGKVLFDYLPSMRPMAFRRPQDFVALLLALLAVFALGRQHSRDISKLGMMALSLVLSIRVQRDSWYVVLIAVAVLAEVLSAHEGNADEHSSCRTRVWERAAVAVAVAGIFVTSATRLPDPKVIMAKAGGVFPVKACDFIQSNQLPGPVFNNYDWGNFLIWYLPDHPVAISGRSDLYGDEIVEQYFKTVTGAQDLVSDPTFAAARTILLARKSDMALALTTVPVLRRKFRVVYQDELAIVLVPQ